MEENKGKYNLGAELLKDEDKYKEFLISEAFAIPKDFGYDGPPCLRDLAINGIPANGRTTTLYAAGVYARKRNPDDWKLAVAHFNLTLIQPPVPHDEVDAIIKKVSRKTYRYPCEDNPLRSICDKKTCAQRDYGVEGTFSTGDVTFGNLRVVRGSVPTTWIIDVNGKDLHLYTEELMSQTAFAERLMEKLYMLMEPMKKDAWRELLAKKLAEVEHVNDDDDITDNYKFDHLIEKFFNNNPGNSPDDIAVGRVYLKSGQYYFQLKHLVSYLVSNGHKNVAARDLTPVLRRMGGDNRFHIRVRGSAIRTWMMPASSIKKEVKGGDIVD